MSSILKTMDSIQELIRRYKEREYPFHLTNNTKCLYCSKILISAYQTDCGCRYCKECLEEYRRKGNTKCLGTDCEDIIKTMPDNAVNREISNMKVFCLYKTEGCPFEDSLKNMNSHLIDCEFRPVLCSECKESVTSNLLDNHLLEKCPMRIEKCKYCQKLMPLKILESSHFNAIDDDLCEKFTGVCPNNCSDKSEVVLRDHRLVCKNKLIDCLFLEYGCKHRFILANINQHFTEYNVYHSEILIGYLSKQISTVNENYDNLCREHKAIKMDRDNLKLEVKKLQQDSNRSSSNASRSTVNITRNRDSIVIHRQGTYIWKIDKFTAMKQSAMNGDRLSVTSEPFYTREFGYKMSMKIYPAGDGVGKGTYLSVFFTLMKGDYDDLLQWPFKNKVTLTILDQKNKTNDYSDTFKPDPRSTCYQQPIEEYNIASGSPKFITFDQLNETYLKNDTIYLKIHVLV